MEARNDRKRPNGSRPLPAAALFLFTGIAGATSADAHDLQCGGSVAPNWVKKACCGVGDSHVLSPGDIHQDKDGNWHFMAGAQEVVVPDSQALPAEDGCYRAFYRDDGSGRFVEPWRDGKPDVWCFFVPMTE